MNKVDNNDRRKQTTTPTTISAVPMSTLEFAISDPSQLDLDNFLPYVIDKVMAHWHVRFSELLASEGLTFEKWRILLITSRRGPMNIRQLSDETVLPYSTLGRWVNHMVNEGLIRRENSTRDGRSVTIRITSSGTRKLASVFPLAMNECRYAMSGLSPIEEIAILHLFRRIEANIKA